jgi:hypothetical protein
VADFLNCTSVDAARKLHADSDSVSSRLNTAFVLGNQGVAASLRFWIFPELHHHRKIQNRNRLSILQNFTSHMAAACIVIGVRTLKLWP